jgi:hypothetical protein
VEGMEGNAACSLSTGHGLLAWQSESLKAGQPAKLYNSQPAFIVRKLHQDHVPTFVYESTSLSSFLKIDIWLNKQHGTQTILYYLEVLPQITAVN